MFSINDILMKFDPNYRLKTAKINLDTQLAKAKLDQKERHHYELLSSNGKISLRATASRSPKFSHFRA